MPAMTDTRIKSFKNKGKDNDELRRRRTDVTVELRKAKKDDQMLKRRNVGSFTSVSPLKEINQSSANFQMIPLSRISEILSNFECQSENDIMNAVQSVRKMLSRERNPPIDNVINAGLVPQMVDLLWKCTSTSIQFETAWAITNVASGNSDQTKHVVKSGAVPIFIHLLKSPDNNVAEQAVWALGNIAGDGPELRDFVLEQGILGPLLSLVAPGRMFGSADRRKPLKDNYVAPGLITLLETGVQNSFIRNVTWTLSNLCRNKNPPPKMEEVQPALPHLANLLYHPDAEVVADACWAISYLTDGANDRIEVVMSTEGIVRRIVELLDVEEVPILTPALRAAGNMVTGTDEHTQRVVDAGALPSIARLLKHAKMTLVKEAAWTVSNITAGNQTQIQSVIEANVVPAIIDVLEKGDYKSQKEAVWVITNFTSGGHPQQVFFLIQSGVIAPLCDLLAVKDPKVVLVILDALNNILLNSERLGKLEFVCIAIEECGGIDKLELLQEHSNEQVSKLSYEIIDRFFSDDDDADTIVEPEVVDEMGVFSFSAPSTVPQQGFSL